MVKRGGGGKRPWKSSTLLCTLFLDSPFFILFFFVFILQGLSDYLGNTKRYDKQRFKLSGNAVDLLL